MKAVLLPIQPKWCELIATGQKTVEVRKSAPKLETPFKCYIYETKAQYVTYQKGALTKYGYGRGKVIGEFVCDCIEKEHVEFTACANIGRLYWCCMSLSELTAYIGKGDYAFYWHISELKIYDKPKELSEFKRPCDRFLDCFVCRRSKRDEFGGCDSKICRPPQSYMYVEEI